MNMYKLTFIALMMLMLPANLEAQASPANARPVMNTEMWREDLRFMAAEIEKLHKNAFHKISRDEFYFELKALDEKIPSLENHQILVEIMKIVAMIGDGHTGVRWGLLAEPGVLPVRFYHFEDGIYIQRALPEHRELLGNKLIAVNGIPIEKAVEKLSPYIWRDNEMGIKSAAPIYMSVPRILHAVGLSPSKETGTFTLLKDGRERVVEIRPNANLGQLWEPPSDWAAAIRADVPVPLWLKQPGNSYWYEILTDSKTLYVQFNEVQNKPNEETVETFFAKIFDMAEKQPVERLVIDMRHNGGGNNYLNLSLTIGAVKSRLNVKGKFFVIIGRETFSAAQNAVNDLEKYTNAIFVGEPTGASPNHFGDARPIILPNSKIRLQASTLWWQDKDPRDNRKWKAPHIAADLTFADYQNGRDPAMEAILKYTPEPTLREIVGAAREKGDVPGFIAKYKAFKANPAHKYEDTETVLNQIGHFLLGAKQNDQALTIFKMNASENPKSAIVYQSLGDAFAIIGDKNGAILNYEEAVRLNPKLTAAKEALAFLKKN